jgi:hypothetical protein
MFRLNLKIIYFIIRLLLVFLPFLLLIIRPLFNLNLKAYLLHPFHAELFNLYEISIK